MALMYNSNGMLQASQNLKTSATKLESIFKELEAAVDKAEQVYQSETATQLYTTFDKIKAQFPDFLDCVNNCSRYLSDTVAPAYQRLENEAASKVA